MITEEQRNIIIRTFRLFHPERIGIFGSGGAVFAALIIFFAVCSCRKDDEVIRSETVDVTGPEMLTRVSGFYLLNEGNMGSNKASLDYFDYATGRYRRNIYPEKNPGKVMELGDVGNDIKVYGDKLYAVINCSNRVEVMSVSDTARHLASIDITNCRYIAFREGKGYVSAYYCPVQLGGSTGEGCVAEIDTGDLKILRRVKVGFQPEEMAVVNGKLYVANSGGYHFPDYDRTLSVIDLETFSVVNTINVGINPHRVKADAYGDLYVSSRGNHGDVPSNLYVVDTQTSRVKKIIDIPADNLYISGDSLYLFCSNRRTGAQKSTVTYGIVDVKEEEVVSRSFITDGTEKDIVLPYGIAINPETKEIFITDAKDYVTPGTLYCFDKFGKKKWSVATGDIPAHIAFTGK